MGLCWDGGWIDLFGCINKEEEECDMYGSSVGKGVTSEILSR